MAPPAGDEVHDAALEQACVDVGVIVQHVDPSSLGKLPVDLLDACLLHVECSRSTVPRKPVAARLAEQASRIVQPRVPTGGGVPGETPKSRNGEALGGE